MEINSITAIDKINNSTITSNSSISSTSNDSKKSLFKETLGSVSIDKRENFSDNKPEVKYKLQENIVTDDNVIQDKELIDLTKNIECKPNVKITKVKQVDQEFINKSPKSIEDNLESINDFKNVLLNSEFNDFKALNRNTQKFHDISYSAFSNDYKFISLTKAIKTESVYKLSLDIYQKISNNKSILEQDPIDTSLKTNDIPFNGDINDNLLTKYSVGNHLNNNFTIKNIVTLASNYVSEFKDNFRTTQTNKNLDINNSNLSLQESVKDLSLRLFNKLSRLEDKVNNSSNSINDFFSVTSEDLSFFQQNNFNNKVNKNLSVITKTSFIGEVIISSSDEVKVLLSNTISSPIKNSKSDNINSIKQISINNNSFDKTNIFNTNKAPNFIGYKLENYLLKNVNTYIPKDKIFYNVQNSNFVPNNEVNKEGLQNNENIIIDNSILNEFIPLTNQSIKDNPVNTNSLLKQNHKDFDTNHRLDIQNIFNTNKVNDNQTDEIELTQTTNILKEDSILDDKSTIIAPNKQKSKQDYKQESNNPNKVIDHKINDNQTENISTKNIIKDTSSNLGIFDKEEISNNLITNNENKPQKEVSQFNNIKNLDVPSNNEINTHIGVEVKNLIDDKSTIITPNKQQSKQNYKQEANSSNKVIDHKINNNQNIKTDNLKPNLELVISNHNENLTKNNETPSTLVSKVNNKPYKHHLPNNVLKNENKENLDSNIVSSISENQTENVSTKNIIKDTSSNLGIFHKEEVNNNLIINTENKSQTKQVSQLDDNIKNLDVPSNNEINTHIGVEVKNLIDDKSTIIAPNKQHSKQDYKQESNKPNNVIDHKINDNQTDEIQLTQITNILKEDSILDDKSTTIAPTKKQSNQDYKQEANSSNKVIAHKINDNQNIKTDNLKPNELVISNHNENLTKNNETPSTLVSKVNSKPYKHHLSNNVLKNENKESLDSNIVSSISENQTENISTKNIIKDISYNKVESIELNNLDIDIKHEQIKSISHGNNLANLNLLNENIIFESSETYDRNAFDSNDIKNNNLTKDVILSNKTFNPLNNIESNKEIPEEDKDIYNKNLLSKTPVTKYKSKSDDITYKSIFNDLIKDTNNKFNNINSSMSFNSHHNYESQKDKAKLSNENVRNKENLDSKKIINDKLYIKENKPTVEDIKTSDINLVNELNNEKTFKEVDKNLSPNYELLNNYVLSSHIEIKRDKIDINNKVNNTLSYETNENKDNKISELSFLRKNKKELIMDINLNISFEKPNVTNIRKDIFKSLDNIESFKDNLKDIGLEFNEFSYVEKINSKVLSSDKEISFTNETIALKENFITDDNITKNSPLEKFNIDFNKKSNKEIIDKISKSLENNNANVSQKFIYDIKNTLDKLNINFTFVRSERLEGTNINVNYNYAFNESKANFSAINSLTYKINNKISFNKDLSKDLLLSDSLLINNSINKDVTNLINKESKSCGINIYSNKQDFSSKITSNFSRKNLINDSNISIAIVKNEINPNNSVNDFGKVSADLLSNILVNKKTESKNSLSDNTKNKNVLEFTKTNNTLELNFKDSVLPYTGSEDLVLNLSSNINLNYNDLDSDNDLDLNLVNISDNIENGNSEHNLEQNNILNQNISEKLIENHKHIDIDSNLKTETHESLKVSSDNIPLLTHNDNLQVSKPIEIKQDFNIFSKDEVINNKQNINTNSSDIVDNSQKDSVDNISKDTKVTENNIKNNLDSPKIFNHENNYELNNIKNNSNILDVNELKINSISESDSKQTHTNIEPINIKNKTDNSITNSMKLSFVEMNNKVLNMIIDLPIQKQLLGKLSDKININSSIKSDINISINNPLISLNDSSFTENIEPINGKNESIKNKSLENNNVGIASKSDNKLKEFGKNNELENKNIININKSESFKVIHNISKDCILNNVSNVNIISNKTIVTNLYNEGFEYINKLRNFEPKKTEEKVYNNTLNKNTIKKETVSDLSKRLFDKLEDLRKVDEVTDNSFTKNDINNYKLPIDNKFISLNSNSFYNKNVPLEDKVIYSNETRVNKFISKESSFIGEVVYIPFNNNIKIIPLVNEDYNVNNKNDSNYIGKFNDNNPDIKIETKDIISKHGFDNKFNNNKTQTLEGFINKVISKIESNIQSKKSRDKNIENKSIYTSIQSPNFLSYELKNYIAKNEIKEPVAQTFNNISLTDIFRDFAVFNNKDNSNKNEFISSVNIEDEFYNNNEFEYEESLEFDNSYENTINKNNLNSNSDNIGFIPRLINNLKQSNKANPFELNKPEVFKNFEQFKQYIKSEFSDVKNLEISQDKTYKHEEMNIINKKDFINVNSVKEKIQFKDFENKFINEDTKELVNPSISNIVNSASVIQAINQGLPIHFAQIPKVISEVVSNIKNNKPIVLNISLNPFNMGELNLSFTLTDNNKMSIAFEASTLAAYKAMESYFNNIKTIVKENSLVLQELSASYSPNGIKPITQRDSSSDSGSFSGSSDDSDTSDNDRQVRRKRKRGKYDDKEELKVDI
ncbi:MAG: hypothetical protein U0354_10965 [Candidatus Sericytochromatia bacterium]